MTASKLVLGIDFGTDSVRSVIVDAGDGRELASEVSYYRRWAAGLYCDSARNMFRQHPLDYTESLEESVRGALHKLGKNAGSRVVGIGIDTTGSTPCAVDRGGTPLALTKGFEENPNAMFVLWKDHTAVEEAALINRVARGVGRASPSGVLHEDRQAAAGSARQTVPGDPHLGGVRRRAHGPVG